MALASAQVIDAIATRLAGTATTVTTSRMHPFTEAELPAWRVLSGGDSIEPSTDGAIEKHALEVVLTGSVRAVADIDDALHALVAAGLAAVHAVQAAQFAVTTSSVSEPRLTNEGESAVAAIAVRLSATYYTERAAPELLL